MGNVVIWRNDPNVPGRQLGRVGNLDLFVIGHDRDDGLFMLLAREVLGFGDVLGDGYGLVKYYPTPQDAQRAAEERVARVLSAMDLVPRSGAQPPQSGATAP